MNKPDHSIALVAAEPRLVDQRLLRHWSKAALLLLAVVLVAAAYWGTAAKRPTYPVSRGELLQTIVASGRVQTPRRVEIGSQIIGTVASIPVDEGQSVKRGQLLILLDGREAKAAVEQSRATVSQAGARLVQLRELSLPVALQAVRQAEVTLHNAQRHYDRDTQLHSQGFIGQSQLDDSQRGVDLAESLLSTARMQAKSNGFGGSDYLMAKTALDQAQASLRMALAKLEYSAIQAPADGTLIARDVERGDVVQPGKVLMVLSPAGQTQLVVQMDERNLAALHIGQNTLASADAYPDQRFPARLVYINPAVDPQRGSVEVKFDVPDPPDYLRQDMTVSVDIEVARRAGVLMVPADAVHEASGGAVWVWKVRDGRAVRQPVRLGLRGTGKVEIVQGLRESDQVVGGGAVREGQRLRPLPADGSGK